MSFFFFLRWEGRGEHSQLLLSSCFFGQLDGRVALRQENHRHLQQLIRSVNDARKRINPESKTRFEADVDVKRALTDPGERDMASRYRV